MKKRAQEIAFLTPGLPITVRDERVSPVHEQVYFYADGLRSFITEINAHAQPLHEPIYLFDTMKVNRTPAHVDAITIQIAFQFTDRDETYLQGYANS